MSVLKTISKYIFSMDDWRLMIYCRTKGHYVDDKLVNQIQVTPSFDEIQTKCTKCNCPLLVGKNNDERYHVYEGI